jgi:uncharacterized membrane-anchored protein
MRRFVCSLPLALSALLFLPALPLHAQDSEDEPPVEAEGEGEPMEGEEFQMPTKIELPGLRWTDGPADFPIGSMARIDVPAGYRATDVRGTRILMEAMGNPPSPNELATLMPADSVDWFVTFTWDSCGYVKDDDKDDLDADDLLEALRKGNDQANAYRRQHGESPLTIVGWERKPFYNTATNNLEWAIKATSAEGPVVNFNVRILGRAGVMEANLVCDPQILSATLPTFQKLLTGFAYSKGNTYGEYKKGDKIAEYGLTGLIAGGALAVAAKTGILQKFWKFILIGLVAIGGFFKKLFGGKGGGERPRRTAGGSAPRARPSRPGGPSGSGPRDPSGPAPGSGPPDTPGTAQ